MHAERLESRATLVIGFFVTALASSMFIASKLVSMDLSFSVGKLADGTTRIVEFGLPSFSAGAISYALTFLCVCAVCEVLGRKRGLALVITGLVVYALCAGIAFMALWLPADHQWKWNDEAFNRVMMPDVKFLAAGLAAYLVTQLLNLFVFDALRRAMSGRALWARILIASGVAMAIDSVIFVLLAYANRVVPGDIPWLVVGSFAIKFLIAIVSVPVVYAAVFWMRGRVVEPKVEPAPVVTA
jgi:uncharacterized integral membrane protein (TIGR00697 family)